MVDSEKHVPAPPDDMAAIEAELGAIKGILAALSNLEPKGRTRVVEYVLQRLGLTRDDDQSYGARSSVGASVASASETTVGGGKSPQDIRSLREQKQPRSAVEMATLAAYYLAEVAPTSMHKAEIEVADINTYFKQAGFPIPSEPRQTLFHAKAAGYLDSAGRGAYRLNPVGHNLIVHGLPAASGDSSVRPRKRGRKKPKARGSAKTARKK